MGCDGCGGLITAGSKSPTDSTSWQNLSPNRYLSMSSPTFIYNIDKLLKYVAYTQGCRSVS